jgi:hypothetical protein
MGGWLIATVPHMGTARSDHAAQSHCKIYMIMGYKA